MVGQMNELPWAYFIGILTPFKRTERLSKYFPKASPSKRAHPPNTIALEVRISTYEFGGKQAFRPQGWSIKVSQLKKKKN